MPNNLCGIEILLPTGPGQLGTSHLGDWRQFGNGLAAGEDGHRNALEIVEGNPLVDSEMLENRSPKAVGAHGAFHGVFALLVGGANDLPGAHAATGDEHAHRLGPVVAAGLIHLGLGTDLRAVRPTAVAKRSERKRDFQESAAKLFLMPSQIAERNQPPAARPTARLLSRSLIWLRF